MRLEVLPQRSENPRSPYFVAEYSEERGPADLPDSELTKTRWPERRAIIASASSRASTTGARRFTSSTRSSCSSEYDVSSPGPGQRRVGHEHVDVPRRLEQPRRPVGGRQVRHERAPADRGRHRLELLRAPPRHEHRRAPRRHGARGRGADPAGRAGHQHGRRQGPARAPRLARRRHAKTATVAVKLWTKYSPPTGPISPAAKNPAAGAPPSSSESAAASWW